MRRNAILLAGITIGLVLGVGIAARATLGGTTGIMIPYSGHLDSNGGPVSSAVPYAFSFRLFDAPSGGSQCPTVYNATSPVYAGTFTVAIGPVDPTCVVGKEIYLQISVTPADSTTPVTLLGRQRVNPSVAALTTGPSDLAVGGDLTIGGRFDTGLARGTTFDNCYIAGCPAGTTPLFGIVTCPAGERPNNSRINGAGWYGSCTPNSGCASYIDLWCSSHLR